MIQAIMYFLLGLLTAGLLVLAVTPAFWRRAIRLSRRRVESTIPLTMAEIQAGRDQLRAEHAISTRRLELSLDRVEERAARQGIEVSRQQAEIARLTAVQSAKSDAIKELESHISERNAAMALAEARIAEAQAELMSRDRRLDERAVEIAELQKLLLAEQRRNEEQRVELVARNTSIGNLEDALAGAKEAFDALSRERDALAATLAEERDRLVKEEARGESLEARLRALEAERTDRIAALQQRTAEVRTLEAEAAGDAVRRQKLLADVAGLEAERTEHLRELTRRSEEIAALKAEIAAAPTADVVADGDNVRKAITAAETENAALQARLAGLEDEQRRLRAENDDLRRAAGPGWEEERATTVRLRAKLDEIAANVVRMADATPKPLVDAAEANGSDAAKDDGAEAPKSPEAAPAAAAGPGEAAAAQLRSLGQRIRALQQVARQ